jgi:hypothetical protein
MLSAAQYVLTQTLPTVAGTIKTSDQPDLSDYDQNAQALLNTQYHNGEPLVVIYHTHTTESYNADPSATTYRSTDPTQNMVTIGAIVSQILYEEYGIQVLHITETFDQPYDTAYEKSLAPYRRPSNNTRRYNTRSISTATVSATAIRGWPFTRRP